MFNLPIGFGVVVSLGERDWTNSLQEEEEEEEEEGDAKDFPHQLLLGGFSLSWKQIPSGFSVGVGRASRCAAAAGPG